MLIIEKILDLIHVGKEIEKDLIIVSAHYNDVGIGYIKVGRRILEDETGVTSYDCSQF